MTILLELQQLTKHFGGLAAVARLDLEVREGEILGLIGPNGAGKTTVFNLITGVHKPTSGKILFMGQDITGLRPDQVAKRKLIRTFQSTTLFQLFPAVLNVVLGFHLQAEKDMWKALFNTRGSRRQEQEILAKAQEIIHFLELDEWIQTPAQDLPHGPQRILGVAIALAAEPKLLLLDEPVTGMNPEETQHMMEIIKKIRDKQSVTVVLVEHDMQAVMGLCDRISVLSFGQKLAEGTPEEIQDNPEVIEAYLGVEEDV